MKPMKYFADFLTLSRIMVAIMLGGLGFLYGKDGWYVVTLLLILSWTTDLLDGYLARRSAVSFTTWIGEHDLYFDMVVALGLLIFLSSCGSIGITTCILYILGWLLLFSRFGIMSAFGKLFQAPVYGWFIISTFFIEPLLGGLILIFLLVIIILTWPRFPQETIPSFLTGFGDRKGSHR